MARLNRRSRRGALISQQGPRGAVGNEPYLAPDPWAKLRGKKASRHYRRRAGS